LDDPAGPGAETGLNIKFSLNLKNKLKNHCGLKPLTKKKRIADAKWCQFFGTCDVITMK
jgi:hypothetical protein